MRTIDQHEEAVESASYSAQDFQNDRMKFDEQVGLAYDTMTGLHYDEPSNLFINVNTGLIPAFLYFLETYYHWNNEAGTYVEVARPLTNPLPLKSSFKELRLPIEEHNINIILARKKKKRRKKKRSAIQLENGVKVEADHTQENETIMKTKNPEIKSKNQKWNMMRKLGIILIKKRDYSITQKKICIMTKILLHQLAIT